MESPQSQLLQVERVKGIFRSLFRLGTPEFGQRLLWLTLAVCLYLSFDIHLDYSGLKKNHTVSVLGYFFDLGSATDSTLHYLRLTFALFAALWLAKKLTPWCGWACLLSFTALVSIYWENLPWFRHKFILPNLLLFVLALWYQFFGVHLKAPGEELKTKDVQPNWVHYLSLWSVCMFYGLSGIAKLRGDWTLGDGTSLQLWFHLLVEEGHPMRTAVIHSDTLAAVLQSGAMMVELSCFAALIFTRYRVLLAILLTTFHLTVQFTFGIPFLTNIPLLCLILLTKDSREKWNTPSTPSGEPSSGPEHPR